MGGEDGCHFSYFFPIFALIAGCCHLGTAKNNGLTSFVFGFAPSVVFSRHNSQLRFTHYFFKDSLKILDF